MKNSIDIIERLLFDKNCIDREEFQSYCNKHYSGGIIPTNISIEQLISENDIMIESLLHVLSKKDILSIEDNSTKKIKTDDAKETFRELVLDKRQKIDALFDYLKFKDIITHDEMKNSFKVIIER